jgi:tRNA intron endonuclease
MKAIIKEDGKVKVEDGLEDLSLVETFFLLERDKIELFSDDGRKMNLEKFFEIGSRLDPRFEIKCIVYRDLRERGYHVKHGLADFRLYPRGKKPGEGEATRYIYAVSEREPLPMKYILQKVKMINNIRKTMILAVVDEEGGMTYYSVKEAIFKPGERKAFETKYIAHLVKDNVFLWDSPERALNDLFEGGFYGKPFGGILQLSLIESAYLLEKNIIRIVKGGEEISIDEFFAHCSDTIENFSMIYGVYRDLRETGLIVKTGFKFGSHFRIYEKMDLMAFPHSRYLVHVFPIDHVFKIPDISRAVRLANSVKKRMIFAGVGDAIDYIDITRIKL